jgi:hypothetical protein
MAICPVGPVIYIAMLAEAPFPRQNASEDGASRVLGLRDAFHEGGQIEKDERRSNSGMRQKAANAGRANSA